MGGRREVGISYGMHVMQGDAEAQMESGLDIDAVTRDRGPQGTCEPVMARMNVVQFYDLGGIDRSCRIRLSWRATRDAEASTIGACGQSRGCCSHLDDEIV